MPSKQKLLIFLRTKKYEIITFNFSQLSAIFLVTQSLSHFSFIETLHCQKLTEFYPVVTVTGQGDIFEWLIEAVGCCWNSLDELTSWLKILLRSLAINRKQDRCVLLSYY